LPLPPASELAKAEIFNDILSGNCGAFKIERIVSHGQCTEGWYDQEQDEWVLVVSGAAILRIRDESESRRMGPGDYIFIPAHKPHRVEWTDPEQPTIWLAIHLFHH